MLDKFRSTHITWDKATSRIYSPVTANASDENGRKLVVQVVNSGQVEDLTGATLHLYWETRDKAYDGLDVFKAVNLEKGEFELSYTTGMLSNQGVLNANLVLIDTVGRVVSERFKITVTEGIDDDAIQSSDSFTALTQALAQVSTINNKADRAELLALESTFEQNKLSVEQQLQQTNKPLRYGPLEMPADFNPILPATFYRDNDGVIRHNMDFQGRYKNGTKIYAMVDGDNATGDGSLTKPFKTVRKAIEVAIAGTDSRYEIHTNIPVINRDELWFNQTIINKTIAIISSGSEKASMAAANRYHFEPTDLSGTWVNPTGERPYTTTVGDSLVMEVYGSDIVFGYRGNQNGGIVELVVDGVYKTTLSTFSPVSSYKEKVAFVGLPEGNHTVSVNFIGADSSSVLPARLELNKNVTPETNLTMNTFRAVYYGESNKPKYLRDKTLVTNNAVYVWESDGAGTYKTNRSGVRGVIDLFNVDVYALPIPLKQAISLADCRANKNTWFLDGSTIYVHRLDGQMPTTKNTVINISATQNEPIIGDGGVLYFENFIFTQSRDNNALMVRNTSNEALGEVCFNACAFVGQRNNGSTGNGLATTNIKNVFVFDCINAYAQKDGYNYHYLEVPIDKRRDCLIVEYNCKGYDLGLDVLGNNSNNASSAHEGVNIVRFGTVGYRNTGATIIDVNGCYSVLYDCHARSSISHGTAFSFTSDGAGTGLGKTHMYNCSAMDCEIALNIGSTHVGYINNFKREGSISGAGVINMI